MPDTKCVLVVLMLCSSYAQASLFTPLQLTTSNRTSEHRIVGGQNATVQLTKHQVSLRFASIENQYGAGRGFFCGGSVLSETTILTAAHCLFSNGKLVPVKEILVVVGSLLLNDKSNLTEKRKAIGYKLHEKFNKQTFENDIAIIRLEKPLPMQHPTIARIPMSQRQIPEGTTCMVSGWGALQSGGGATNQLQFVNVTVLSTAKCNANTSYNGEIMTGMFCAGSFMGGIDSCQGDSGGPLVCNGIQEGIVSWGDGCARPQFPGVYASVYHYRGWIQKNAATTVRHLTAMMSISIALIIVFVRQCSFQ